MFVLIRSLWRLKVRFYAHLFIVSYWQVLLILNLPWVKREKNWTFWLFWLEGIVLAGEDVGSEYKPRLVSKSEIYFLEDDIILFPFSF